MTGTQGGAVTPTIAPPPSTPATAVGPVPGRVVGVGSSFEEKKQTEELEGIRIANVTKIIAAWPLDALAEQLIGIGLGSLGAGGLVYVLLGYPGLELRSIPTFVAWAVASVSLYVGLARLRAHTDKRLRYFEQVFKIQAATAGTTTSGGFWRRLFRRQPGRKGGTP